MIVLIRSSPVSRLYPAHSMARPRRVVAYTGLPMVMANASSDTFVRLSKYTLDLLKISKSFNKRMLIFYHYTRDSQVLYDLEKIYILLFHLLIMIVLVPIFWLPVFIAVQALSRQTERPVAAAG